jgi:hypothetical protein
MEKYGEKGTFLKHFWQDCRNSIGEGAELVG